MNGVKHGVRRALLGLAGNRRASAAVVFGLMTPLLLGGVGFGVDSALLYVSESRLQTTADAAALAGASSVRTQVSAVATKAIAIAQTNMPVVPNGNVLVATDVVPGSWDQGSRQFRATNVSPNAVRTTTRLATANGNPHRLVFGRFLNMPTANMSASAVANAVVSCTANPYLSYLYAGQPTRTSIVTLGEGTSPVTYLETTDKHPIVRVDNGYDGPAVVSFGIAGRGNYSFNAPSRGQFAVAVTSITDNVAPGSLTLVFNKVSSVPVNPGGYGGGTATWVNRIRTVAQLPGTTICVAGTTRTKTTLVG